MKARTPPDPTDEAEPLAPGPEPLADAPTFSEPEPGATFADFGPESLVQLHGGEEIDQPAPAGRQPDFMWAGQPVYRCRLCGDQYERVNNLPAVLEHEASHHPTNARQSHILGPDGRPLIVVD